MHPTAGAAFTYTYFGVRVFLISHQIKPDDLVCIHHDVRWWNRASASPHCGRPPHPQRGVCGVPRHPANTIPHRRSLTKSGTAHILMLFSAGFGLKTHVRSLSAHLRVKYQRIVVAQRHIRCSRYRIHLTQWKTHSSTSVSY